jgi:SAM-dependent methyltransferase
MAVAAGWMRLKRGWQRHGVRLPLLAIKTAWYAIRRRSRPVVAPAELAFDRTHGVDTAGVIEAGALSDVVSENWRHSGRYQPSDTSRLPELLGACGIDFRDYVFVDFGCGKGRVLLAASHFPFRAVIGVEFSAALQQTAQRNIASYRPAARQCSAVEALHGDAAEYTLPDHPAILYFYNPFDAVIMERVVARATASWRANPRDLRAIYVDPRHRQVFDARPEWELQSAARGYAVYRTRTA